MVRKGAPDMRRKVFEGEVDVKAAEAAEQMLTARVSTSERDRDGEVVEPGGIDYSRYRDNPVLLWSHKWDEPPIGKAVSIGVDKAGLSCKFQFAPTEFGREVFGLYKGGYLRAFSIGFQALEFDKETKTHRRIELLEVSAVPVPSNVGALVTAIGKGLFVSKGLRQELGLKDEIFISDLGPSDVKSEGLGIPEATRRILIGRAMRILAKIDRVQEHLSAEKKREIIVNDLRRADLKANNEIDISPEELDRLIEKTVREAAEVAVAKVRGRVI